jgi:hypothetical protein
MRGRESSISTQVRSDSKVSYSTVQGLQFCQRLCHCAPESRDVKGLETACELRLRPGEFTKLALENATDSSRILI